MCQGHPQGRELPALHVNAFRNAVGPPASSSKGPCFVRTRDKHEWGIRVTSRAEMTIVCVLRTHVSNKLLHAAEAAGPRAGLPSENHWPGRGDKTRSGSLWWLKGQPCVERVEEAWVGISGACGIHQGALELMLRGCISWRLNHNLWCGRLGKRG